MEEFNKLVARYHYQYQCKTNVDVSSSSDSSGSDSDSETNITSGLVELSKCIKASTKEMIDNKNESGKHKRNSETRTQRLPTRRPDPNVYNRNALLARENRRKKKAYMEAVEKELNETRSKNRWLFKALKKQFKLTQKLKIECDYLKSSLPTSNKMSMRFITDIPAAYNHRAVSPDGSLISTNSSNCSNNNNNNNENQMDKELIADLVNVDNGSVAEQQYLHETPSSSWNDFIDNLLTDYQPTPEYENENETNYLEQSFVGLTDLETPLETSCLFNKIVSPSCDWSASCTPPSQLLQDEDFLDFDDAERIASL
ncbi:hypothetical protein KR093_010644 [Drosophila rubida]|uniref:BZIP domain-containing protein n=1 Tax=Drosophila rubida TaxID=30044 RepID=A0AAD4PII2_9MUSC|nr:hypothetical protein KR093_010644 [Drosophila rubida]